MYRKRGGGDIIAAVLNTAKCSIQFSTRKQHNNNVPPLFVGCHMNGYFVGAVIYADAITLLGPIRYSIL